MKSKSKLNPQPSEFSRRDFLRRTVKGAAFATLFAGLPKGWTGTAYASDAPETAALNFGMIALLSFAVAAVPYVLNGIGKLFSGFFEALNFGSLTANENLNGSLFSQATQNYIGSFKDIASVIKFARGRTVGGIDFKGEFKAG